MPCAHMERSWYTQNMGCELDKSIWLAKGKPEEMPHMSDLNYHGGAIQSKRSMPRLYIVTLLI